MIFLNSVESLLLFCIPSQLPSLSTSVSKMLGPIDQLVAFALYLKDGIPLCREEMCGMGKATNFQEFWTSDPALPSTVWEFGKVSEPL